MDEETPAFLAKHRSRLPKHYQNLGDFLVYKFYTNKVDDIDLEIMAILKRKIEKALIKPTYKGE